MLSEETSSVYMPIAESHSNTSSQNANHEMEVKIV